MRADDERKGLWLVTPLWLFESTFEFTPGRPHHPPKPPMAYAPLWLRDSKMVLCVTEIREGRTTP